MILHTENARIAVDFILNHEPEQLEKWLCNICLKNIEYYDYDLSKNADTSQYDIVFYSTILNHLIWRRLDDYDNPPADWPEWCGLL